MCDHCITLTAYIYLDVFLLDALKSVFFRASLAHFKKSGAPVGGEWQLFQHDVLRHANFLPKIHLCIGTQREKERREFGYPTQISDKAFLFISLSFRLINRNYIHTGKKSSHSRALLTCYSCQYDKQQVIFCLNPLLSSACFVVSAACW